MTPKARLPTGTVTFLFTDIEGSTRMVQRLGEAYDLVLERHSAIVRDAVDRHGGVEVSTEGDSFFCVFTDPAEAIRAAVDARRNLAIEDWPGDTAVRLRMGLHTGQARHGGDNYVGVDVNVAARISAAGHGGQILTSAATAALAADPRTGDLELVSLGVHWFKDLDEPIEVFEVRTADDSGSHPPIRSTGAPSNLPTPYTEFVGREVEVGQIQDMVGQHRLVTLTGPGGTGKTRLAVHVATAIADRYPGGAHFVGLDALIDHSQIPAAIARALGVPGGRDLLGSLVDLLSKRKTLLVLDNFEHVVAGAPVVGTLLESCPTLTVLVTSQVALRLRGEHRFDVPALSVPISSARGDVEVADSARLFTSRVRQTDPGFEVTDTNAATVRAVVERLDGLPLAIELAAPRIRLFGLDGLLVELEQHLPDLGGGFEDGPERHRTLFAAVEWSFRLLAPAEQAALQRMSVFVGGFDMEAARAVCGPDVLEPLGSLLDKSLVRSDITATPARFSLLETIRIFGREGLEGSGNALPVGRAHMEHYLAIVSSDGSDVDAEGGAVGVADVVARERANLIAALEWSASHDPAPGLRALHRLARPFEMAGALAEGSTVARRLLTTRDQPRDARLAGLLGAASLHYWMLDYDTAVVQYEEACDVAADVGDEALLGEARFGLAYTYLWLGRVDDADRLAGLAHESFEISMRRELLVHVLALRGSTAWQRGDFVQAAELYTRSVSEASALGDERLRLNSEGVLAGLLLRLGRYRQAASHHLELVNRFVELGDGSSVLMTLDFLCVGLARIDAETGVRLDGAVRALIDTGGGTVPMQVLGIPSTRDIAAESLGAVAIEAAWQADRGLDLDGVVRLARDLATRVGITPTEVDAAQVIAAARAAAET